MAELSPKEELKVLWKLDELKALREYLNGFEFIAYDTETTGLENDAEVVGLCFAAETHKGFYIPLAWWIPEYQTTDCEPCKGEGVDSDGARCPSCKKGKIVKPVGGHMERVAPEVKALAMEILNDIKAKSLVMQNGIVDVNWTRFNFNIDLWDAWHTDTLPLAHLLDEDRPMGYGLKEMGYIEFGEEAKAEQTAVRASVLERGGVWEDKRGGQKEMFKCEPNIFGYYGAKDAVLTLKLFYTFIPQLFEQGLDKFFYEDETMPLFKTVSYDMNMTGLKVEMDKLLKLERDLTVETERLIGEILTDVMPYVKEKYPCTNKKNQFNVGSGQQLAWLLYIRLGNDWKRVTKSGRELAKELTGKVPYYPAARKHFMREVVDHGGKPEKYIQCDKKALQALAGKYTWVNKLLEYRKAKTILKTYAKGMQRFIKYGVIRPSFLQHGTTSGRYSSRYPNFQNLPRDDKRVKSCVVSRPGRSFVGADYSQLEPRTFTSMSQDPILMDGFKRGEDFYAVIGIPTFNLTMCSADKKAPNYLGSETFMGGKYKAYRQIAKVIALSLAYGTTPFKLADDLRGEDGKPMTIDQCSKIRDDYFDTYQGVAQFVADTHLQIVTEGVVYNLFGRPRRIPAAKAIKKLGFPEACNAADLPYQYRTLLNLSVNHRIQSTAASIVNRSAIRLWYRLREEVPTARIVLQVHDEIVCECDDKDSVLVASILKDTMENTVSLPGVALIAEPKIGKTLAELK